MSRASDIGRRWRGMAGRASRAGCRWAGRQARHLPIRRRDRVGQPVLSVIIPVYDVEDYVAACLRSVLRQRPRSMQIIVVDDGSRDDSAAIVRRLAARDRRIELVSTPNRGLGAARNLGLTRAKGTYLTFVDSDDLIPRGAYRHLVASLEQSGSDVAVGAISRLWGWRTSYPDWSRRLHDRDRIGIKLADFPAILRDLYAPNKVYRRALWQAHGLTFREGVLFEDQPVITEVYTHARTIDVLARMTYRWRSREDGSSLSQSMFTAPAIAARVEAVRLTRPVIAATGQAAIEAAWTAILRDEVVPDYAKHLPPDDPAAHEAFEVLQREAYAA